MSATTPCENGATWLRAEGVLAEERGQSIAAHLQACPSCQQLHAEIEELRAALPQLPATAPAPGWQRAVFARIEATHKPRWLRWAATLTPVVATAAVALVLFFRAPTADGPHPMSLSLRFEKGATTLRARGEVAVGDTLALAAANLRAPVAELRVYRDDAGLVFRCTGEVAAATCTRTGERLEARLPVPAIGRYRVLLVSAPAPLPALSGNFDADVGALAAVPGVTWQQADAFEVW